MLRFIVLTWLLALTIALNSACQRNLSSRPALAPTVISPTATPGGGAELPEVPVNAEMEPGFYGYALTNAFKYHAGQTGEFAQDTSELLQYYPWAGDLFGGYRMFEGIGPDKSRTMMIERPLRSPWLLNYLEGRDAVSPSGIRFTPVLGVKDGVERYAVQVGLTEQPDQETVDWWRTEWKRYFPQYVKNNDLPYYPMDQHGFTYNWYEPKDPNIGALLQLKQALIFKSIQGIHWEDSERKVVSDFEAVKKYYGGLNPLFWTNPYTKQPMKEVPMTAPTAGDYSVIASQDGTVMVFFHYEDYNDGVSTFGY